MPTSGMFGRCLTRLPISHSMHLEFQTRRVLRHSLKVSHTKRRFSVQVLQASRETFTTGEGLWLRRVVSRKYQTVAHFERSISLKLLISDVYRLIAEVLGQSTIVKNVLAYMEASFSYWVSCLVQIIRSLIPDRVDSHNTNTQFSSGSATLAAYENAWGGIINKAGVNNV